MDVNSIKKTIVLYDTNTELKKGCSVTSVEQKTCSSTSSDEAIVNNAKVLLNRSQSRPSLICGTKYFKPFNNKNQLARELANFRDKDDNQLFSTEQINDLLEYHSDTTEISLVLDTLLKNKIEFSSQDLFQFLAQEDITVDNIEAKIPFLKEVLGSSVFADLKSKYGEYAIIREILLNDKFDLSKEKLTDNVEFLKLFKENHSDIYEKLAPSHNYFDLRFVFDTKIDKDSLDKIINSGLIDTSLDWSYLSNILKIESSQSSIDNKLDVLNDLKTYPQLSFLFDKNKGLQPWDIISFLYNELPIDFSLEKKQDVINLLGEIVNGIDKQHFYLPTPELVLKILLKPNDDTYADGEKLFKFSNNLSPSLLTECSFAEAVELLNKYSNNPKVAIYCSDLVYGLNKENYEVVYNILDMLNYASEKDCLSANLRTILNCVRGALYNSEPNDYSWLSNPEKYKQKIDELVVVANSLDKNNWDYFAFPIISNVLHNTFDELNTENLEYFKELLENDKFSKFLEHKDNTEVFKFINQDLNIDKLKSNQPAAIKFLDLIQDKFYMLPSHFLLFEGDLEVLFKKYFELNQKYKDTLRMEIDKDSQNVAFTYHLDSVPIKEVYDKDLCLLSIQQIVDNSDVSIVRISTDDKQHNAKHTMDIVADSPGDSIIPKKILSEYFDANGKKIKTKFYNESSLGGVVNIKELTPDGKLKTLSSAYTNEFGTFIQKELTSSDGTKSFIKSHSDLNGNESYIYKIVDKNGNVLLNQVRKTKIIDENTSITTLNDKNYKVIKNSDSIVVIDCQNNEKTIIDFKEKFKKRSKVLENVLKRLPADELIKLNKNVEKLEYTNSLESAFDQYNKIIMSGPNAFILLHELGHAKDVSKNFKNNKISSDIKLQEIFKEEIANLKGSESDCVQEIIDYFIQGANNHYAGVLGGLQEVVAETNALQASYLPHPILQMRTQLLQEHFPKTIAYLVKNYLAS